jgi:hypothetical protein
MTITQNAQDVLRSQGFEYPPNCPVLGIEVEEYTETTGEDALRILVLIDESADIEKVAGQVTGEFKAAIRERLVENGINLFPYVFLAKPSELSDHGEE